MTEILVCSSLCGFVECVAHDVVQKTYPGGAHMEEHLAIETGVIQWLRQIEMMAKLYNEKNLMESDPCHFMKFMNCFTKELLFELEYHVSQRNSKTNCAVHQSCNSDKYRQGTLK